jgi:hypothetical protein
MALKRLSAMSATSSDQWDNEQVLAWLEASGLYFAKAALHTAARHPTTSLNNSRYPFL